jgi:nucleoside-diphosphate-sugar epimerase
MSLRVIVTGGAGFLGAALARRLLASPLSVGGAEAATVTDLVCVDLVPPPHDVASDARIQVRTGQLGDLLGTLPHADLLFHLAGVVSGAAEADFDLGMRTNLDQTRALLDYARAHDRPPVLVFTSSLAVFGSDPAIGPIGIVDDDTLPRPQSSYGVQKFIGEQLVADYTRKGFVRGRSIRLMTVSVRPGRPNAAASAFLSGIIREPLSGQHAVCPVPPDTPVALSSPRRTLDGILRAASVTDAAWGSRTAMNLPALTTTPGQMVAALRRVAGDQVASLVDWTEDPAVMNIVGSWPASFRTPRADRLGLHADTSFDDVIRDYIESSSRNLP